MPKQPVCEHTSVGEFVKVGVWLAATPVALAVTISTARLIWASSNDLFDLLLTVEKEARVQAWATLIGSLAGAFLAGAFAIGAFALERRWQRRDADEKLARLLERALQRHITPPWILEYLFTPLAQNLADTRDFNALWNGQMNEFPCALELSELVEERISEGASDIFAAIHEVRKNRERVFNTIQWAKTQRLGGLELYHSRLEAMGVLVDLWFGYIWICRELIKRNVIVIDQFEESAKRASDKLLGLNGKTALFQMAPPPTVP